MKIIFKTICYDNNPLVWDYDEINHRATWMGIFANANKGIYPKLVIRKLKETDGVEESDKTLIINDTKLFFARHGFTPLLEPQDVQSPRSSGQSFFQSTIPPRIAGSPISMPVTSPKKVTGSNSDSQITRASGSPVSSLAMSTISTSSSGSELITQRLSIGGVSLDSLIPEHNDALASLWRETLVYEESLAKKSEEDQKKRQYQSIKSLPQLTVEFSYHKGGFITPLKGEIIHSLRHLFDKILNPMFNKIRGDEATLPALVIHFRNVIREIMIESPLAPVIREGNYTTTITENFAKKQLRKTAIFLKLSPLLFFVENDIKSTDLVEDIELRRHLDMLKLHLHPNADEITNILDGLNALLWELSEKQDALYLEEQALKHNIDNHLPVNEFMSFYSLLQAWLPSSETSVELKSTVITNVINQMTSIFNTQFCYKPIAQGQISIVREGQLDFYISPELYSLLQDRLNNTKSLHVIPKSKKLDAFVKKVCTTITEGLENHLEVITGIPKVEFDTKTSPKLTLSR